MQQVKSVKFAQMHLQSGMARLALAVLHHLSSIQSKGSASLAQVVWSSISLADPVYHSLDLSMYHVIIIIKKLYLSRLLMLRLVDIFEKMKQKQKDDLSKLFASLTSGNSSIKVRQNSSVLIQRELPKLETKKSAKDYTSVRKDRLHQNLSQNSVYKQSNIRVNPNISNPNGSS